MSSGGVRSSPSETRQVAALPWRVGEEGRQILMITSRETRRWVVPKGGRMAGKTDPQAAAIEAMEEAGVQGKIAEESVGVFRYAKRLKSGQERACVVAVYPLRVLIQLGAWPEAHQRERRWMTPDEAAASVDEPDLARLIAAFGVMPIED
ncbi:MAG: hydrolase [Brevundimonas sp.]|jgi:8-oxo-dGTP pyrophosphatase MutT (NUDIX family)|nr:hydrolase [Brevundimonas sp.]